MIHGSFESPESSRIVAQASSVINTFLRHSKRSGSPEGIGTWKVVEVKNLSPGMAKNSDVKWNGRFSTWKVAQPSETVNLFYAGPGRQNSDARYGEEELRTGRKASIAIGEGPLELIQLTRRPGVGDLTIELEPLVLGRAHSLPAKRPGSPETAPVPCARTALSPFSSSTAISSIRQ